MKLDVHDINGKVQGSIDLPSDIFKTHVNQDLIHQAVIMYQASLRQGTASVKGRGEVSGGGKKPYRQKGTGRARAGSTRSPLWRGGGIVFGPQPRDFSYSVPKKIRQAALRETLNAKYQAKNLVCIVDIKDGLTKTKEFVQIIKSLGLKGKTLAALDGSDDSVRRVSQNIASIDLVRAQDINALDVIKIKNLLVSRTALEDILKRITK